MREYFRAQTYSKYPDRFPEGAPIQAIQAEGASVLCRHVDGSTRWYIDCVNGMGSVILGHSDPWVVSAIVEQLVRGISFPLGTDLERKVANQLLNLLPWERAEMVRFAKNGADVTGAAVKLARAVTGRRVVLKNAYHGHHPWSVNRPPMDGGVLPEERACSIAIQHNDIFRLTAAFERYEIAAVVLEAVPSGDPVMPSAEYLSMARALCDEHGALLILDEVVTGFRMATGGAAQIFAIEPDLACYGKTLANGMPLSALVGPRELMKRIDEDVFFSVTHGGEALSLAAASATLSALVQKNVSGRLTELGTRIGDAISCDEVWLDGYPRRPFFRFDDERMRAVFLEALLEHGVLCQGYINLSLAMTEGDIPVQLLQAITHAREKVEEARCLT